MSKEDMPHAVALALMHEKRYAEAVEVLKPTQHDALMAECLLNLKDWDAALTYAGKCDKKTGCYLMGLAHYNKGDKAAALKCFEDAATHGSTLAKDAISKIGGDK